MLSVECKYKIVKSVNSPLKKAVSYIKMLKCKNHRGGLGGPPSFVAC
jgi:hypothetical protein